MKLIFDIDDTITNETEFMIKKAPKFLKKKLAKEFKINNLYGYDVSSVFGIKEFYINQGYNNIDAEKKCLETDRKFWRKNFYKYLLIPINKEIRKSLRKIYLEGNEIHFVSLRSKKTSDSSSIYNEFLRTKAIPFMTMLQLKFNGIKYTKLVLVSTIEEKLEYINHLKADLVFDDQMEVINQIKNPSRAICITRNHNIKIQVLKGAIRFRHFEDKSLYDLVKKIY